MSSQKKDCGQPVLPFSTHGYFIGVAVSYSWDFLICRKFCEQ